MPRSTDQFSFTNWRTTPVLHNLLEDVQAHFEDAKTGNRANKTIIDVGTNELAESCITALQQLDMSLEEVLDVVSRVFTEETMPAHA